MRLISEFIRSGSSSYFSLIAATCGCKFFMLSEETTCDFVNGNVTNFTNAVKIMIEFPTGYGIPSAFSTSWICNNSFSKESARRPKTPPSVLCGSARKDEEEKKKVGVNIMRRNRYHQRKREKNVGRNAAATIQTFLRTPIHRNKYPIVKRLARGPRVDVAAQ